MLACMQHAVMCTTSKDWCAPACHRLFFLFQHTPLNLLVSALLDETAIALVPMSIFTSSSTSVSSCDSTPAAWPTSTAVYDMAPAQEQPRAETTGLPAVRPLAWFCFCFIPCNNTEFTDCFAAARMYTRTMGAEHMHHRCRGTIIQGCRNKSPHPMSVQGTQAVEQSSSLECDEV